LSTPGIEDTTRTASAVRAIYQHQVFTTGRQPTLRQARAYVLDLVPQAWAARRPGGRLWVAYRKGRRDLTRTELGEAVEGLGLGLT